MSMISDENLLRQYIEVRLLVERLRPELKKKTDAIRALLLMIHEGITEPKYANIRLKKMHMEYVQLQAMERSASMMLEDVTAEMAKRDLALPVVPEEVAGMVCSPPQAGGDEAPDTADSAPPA